MKKLLLSLLACATLFGDEPPKEEPSHSLWDYHPIHIGGNGIWLPKSAVSETPIGGKLKYDKANAFLYMLLPISATSYFFPRVEWNTFTFDWNNNPKFNKTKYYYAQFALTFYTTSVEDWRWILRANYNIDIEHFNQPHDYGLFEGLVWGAYKVHRKWQYHIGALGYTGMEGAQMYPIIGLDFAPNKTWKFVLVFPMDYAVQYHLNENWRFAIRGRPLKERFRTGASEPQPKSVFSYSSMGTEFNIHYERFMRFEAEIYAGCNYGGSFYIKDEFNNNPLYANIGATPYFGATLDYAF